MKIVNMTPHTINVLAKDNSPLMEIKSSGIARAAQKRAQIGEIAGIPVNRTEYGEIEGLPEKEPNTMYIVSALAAQAAKQEGRDDVLIVDDTVRDEQGRIIGCRAFARM